MTVSEKLKTVTDKVTQTLPAAIAVLLLPAAAVFAQADSDIPTRAEFEAMQKQIELLQAEIARLRGDTTDLQAQTTTLKNEAELRTDMQEQGEAPTAWIHDHGTFAPDKPLIKWDRTLTFTDPEERFSLDVRGRIQPRYEFERRQDPDLDDHSSFFLRRLRLDFRGHAYTKDLTFRIMPEWSRTGTLRDGWLDYRFSDAFRVRFGQYNVPFAWERDSSSNRHQFVERSTANNEFEWADGRDIGVMLHGNLSEKWRYGIGMFGGEGRDVRRTSTTGNLYTGRITYAALGSYPGEEALIKPVENVNLAFGAGAGYANRNAARDWHIWSADPAQNADVFGATGDVHFQTGKMSTHLSGFYRDVNPLDGAHSYHGTGFNVQAGYLLIPERLFGSLRYSASQPNTDEREAKQREMIAGLQIYHHGHGAKMHIESGRIQTHDGGQWHDTDIFRMQYQLLF